MGKVTGYDKTEYSNELTRTYYKVEVEDNIKGELKDYDKKMALLAQETELNDEIEQLKNNFINIFIFFRNNNFVYFRKSL